MHHHSPIIYLARLGTKWLAVALILFITANPVTWGVGLALLDHVTGGNAGSRLLGNQSAGEPVALKRGDRLDTLKPKIQDHIPTSRMRI